MSGTGRTLLDKGARRRRMSQVQVASVSARALADRGFLILELTPNSEQERGRGACETAESRGADNSTRLSASPLQGQSSALPGSEESNWHCGSSYQPPLGYI